MKLGPDYKPLWAEPFLKRSRCFQNYRQAIYTESSPPSFSLFLFFWEKRTASLWTCIWLRRSRVMRSFRWFVLGKNVTGDIHKAHHIRVGLSVESLISDPNVQAGKGRKGERQTENTHKGRRGERERERVNFTQATHEGRWRMVRLWEILMKESFQRSVDKTAFRFSVIKKQKNGLFSGNRSILRNN